MLRASSKLQNYKITMLLKLDSASVFRFKKKKKGEREREEDDRKPICWAP
jgi:hypothetical protein